MLIVYRSNIFYDSYNICIYTLYLSVGRLTIMPFAVLHKNVWFLYGENEWDFYFLDPNCCTLDLFQMIYLIILLLLSLHS